MCGSCYGKAFKGRDTLLFGYAYPTIVLTHKNAFAPAVYPDRPMLAVGAAADDGVQSRVKPTHGTAAKRTRVRPPYKEYPLTVYADIAACTVPVGLSVGAFRYTFYVTAEGFALALRVFTVTATATTAVSVGMINVPASRS